MKFTLRDWLWLVIVVALAVLWQMEHQQLTARLLMTERMMESQQALFNSRSNQLEAAIAQLQRTNSAAIAIFKSKEAGQADSRVPDVILDELPPYPQPRPPKPHEQPSEKQPAVESYSGTDVQRLPTHP